MWRRFMDYYTFRSFSISNVRRNIEKSKQNSKPSEATVNPGALHLDFIPSEWDKKVLVWSGKFRSKEEIPPKISFSTLSYARSKLRIKLAHGTMVISILSCVYYIFLGKHKRQKGESIAKMMESSNVGR